jgi:hypothetical protein
MPERVYHRFFICPMTDAITTKPGDRYASLKRPAVYEALRRQGMDKTSAARISNAQAKRGKRRKKEYTVVDLERAVAAGATQPLIDQVAAQCAELPRLKGEQIAPGITRIRGNLCNVHGRYGKCPGASVAPIKPVVKPGKGRRGRRPVKPKKTEQERAAELEAKRLAQDTERRATRDKLLTDAGIDANTQGALTEAREGNMLTNANGAKLASMGLAEQASDGSYRLTASGRGVVDAALRGDAGRVNDTLSAARDAAAKRAAAAAKPKGGGGGGGKKQPEKPTDAEKRAQQQQERSQRASETAAQVGLAASAVADLRTAAETGGVANPELERLGLVQDGQTTDQGRRALLALERGDVRGYQAALQDARARQGRERAATARHTATEQHRTEAAQRRAAAEQARQAREAERERHQQERDAAPERSRAERARRRQAARNETRMQKAASGAGDYLVVEDPAKSSTWHLQVKRNGTPDHGLMGSAWAALHSGFRGNTYQGPQKQQALAKLKKLYASEGMDVPSEKSTSTFAVFKDATGADRWLSVTTTAYQDRDREWISRKAIAGAVAQGDASGQRGPLRFWHVPGLDLGTCDYQATAQDGRFLIESGTFKSAVAARIGRNAAEKGYQMSPGFVHPAHEPHGGVFDHITIFERSIVPAGRASNPFTRLMVKGARMLTDEKKKEFESLAGDAEARQFLTTLLSSVQATDKAAQEQATYKSDHIIHVTDEVLVTVQPGERFKAHDGNEYIKSPSDLDPTGKYFATKAPPFPPASEDAAPAEAETKVDGEEMMMDEPADAGGLTLSPEDLSAIGEAFAQQLAPALAQVMGALDLEKKVAGHVQSLMGPYQTQKDAADAEREAQIAELQSTLKATQDRLAELMGETPAAHKGHRITDNPVVTKEQSAALHTPASVDFDPIVGLLMNNGIKPI